MKHYAERHIDELGKMSLPITLRKKMGLDIKEEVALICIGKIIIMQKRHEDLITEITSLEKIDEMGRIKLSVELREKMGWKVKDGIAIYGVDDEMAILKLA